jgi:hypothetical protein
MRAANEQVFETDFVSIVKVLQAIRRDPLINTKVVNIIKMESYPRRIILSNWLEQLRRKSAPQKLLNALSRLFDDEVAEQVLQFIKKHN